MVNTLGTFRKELQPVWNVITVELTEHLSLRVVEQYSSLGLWYLHHLCPPQLQDPVTKTYKVRPLKQFKGKCNYSSKIPVWGRGGVGNWRGYFSLQLKPISSIAGTFGFTMRVKLQNLLTKVQAILAQRKLDEHAHGIQIRYCISLL